jgi:hypothetical protein
MLLLANKPEILVPEIPPETGFENYGYLIDRG